VIKLGAMTLTNPVWFSVLSDLFVNLSAGWFAAAIIIPIGNRRHKLNLWLLTTNIAFGILALIIAFQLRRLG